MKLTSYLKLMRLNKPIGILLLLWPTLWALWLASQGNPNRFILIIFILGVIIMRSAGCIINDIADRKFDPHVERTRKRPVATGAIKVSSALILFFGLCFCALLLVLQLNYFTIILAFMGAGLTVAYPFLKRYTHLPQVGLGFAFAWGIPMAFAAETNQILPRDWILFVTAAIWPVIYDTMYAMVDMRDDIKIGVKSTAILFGPFNLFILAILQVIMISLLAMVGYLFQLTWPFYFSLLLVAVLFFYQLQLIKTNNPVQCFQAFLNNHWVGLILFIGISLSYYL